MDAPATLQEASPAAALRGEAKEGLEASKTAKEQRSSPPCVSCPQHGAYIHLKEVAASAQPGASRRLVTHANLVYDVTSFHHPGGDDLLEPFIGTDITAQFREVGHSTNAELLLGSLCVGILSSDGDSGDQPFNKDACSCTCREAGDTADGLKAAGLRKRQPAAGTSEVFSSTDEDLGASACTEEQTSYDQQQQIRKSTSAVHGVIDFSKPLVPQIYNLSNDDYQRAVDVPYCKDTVFKLLPWDCLEPITKTKWWMVPAFWVPVCIYLSYTALQRVSVPVFVGAYFFGLFMWSFLEYLLHRFLFHFPERMLPDLGWVRVVHFLLHSVHHMLPMDPLRLVMPPALLLVLSVPVLALMLLCLPEWFVHAGWPGGLTGYVMYDMIHYTTHHFAFFDRITHIRNMKRYHMRHHFKYPLLGFGVSSKLWDYVFGTVIPDRVPLKLSPS